MIEVVNHATPEGWKGVFEKSKDNLEFISERLEEDQAQNGKWLPLRRDLFKAFEVTPLDNVKVVILGQDPYHQLQPGGLPVAMGMSFSVRKGEKVPGSLCNMYTEIGASIEGFQRPNHGDLTGWAKQGVLLLNASLTVRTGDPGSHLKYELWHSFLQHVINAINERHKDVIYLLLGKEAQGYAKMIGTKPIMIQTSHPSGLSVNRGFFGSGVFKRINDILKYQEKEPIDWSSL